MLEYCRTKQAKLAAYRVLVATILTRALTRLKDGQKQLSMAYELIDLIDEDVKKMQDPQFQISEVWCIRLKISHSSNYLKEVKFEYNLVK